MHGVTHIICIAVSKMRILHPVPFADEDIATGSRGCEIPVVYICGLASHMVARTAGACQPAVVPSASDAAGHRYAAVSAPQLLQIQQQLTIHHGRIARAAPAAAPEFRRLE